MLPGSVTRHGAGAAAAGIMFLSGGQSEEEATVNLNAINQLVGALAPHAPDSAACGGGWRLHVP